jgi:hypothetical protein
VFIVQPISNFGSWLCKELDSDEAGQRQWQAFEFAVAWVNRFGAGKIKHPAKGFLAKGGCIRATVGLDFSSTSYEGLVSLLDLEVGAADMTTHVFFDENPACTFHPKVFLFSNAKQARLFVGSNNMTWAGLGTNVEAALGVKGVLGDEPILAARNTLAAWRDEASDSRIRRLTREFLEQLREHNYVRTEEQIRLARIKSRLESGSRGRKPLFGRTSTPIGNMTRGAGGGGGRASHAASSSSGEVLLMKVRPRRNGKQLQISMSVLEAFMKGAGAVFATDGTRRVIGYNEARGVRNTARFEAPEMEAMKIPVARFQWVDGGNHGEATGKVLQFELFDADSGGEGTRILEALEDGIATPPVVDPEQLSQGGTVLSKSNREIAQWYRLFRISGTYRD